MFQEDAGALLARLFLAGPMLYIGLVMATDPKGVAAFASLLSQALHNFQHRTNERSVFFEATEVEKRVMRLFGAVLCAISIVFLSGAAG